MRALPPSRDVEIPLAAGMLDGRSPAGEARVQDLRIALNVATNTELGRRRLGGWAEWQADTTTFSNENLHDQLLGGAGVMEGDTFVATDGQREAITLMLEAPATTGALYFIAGTKSRLYVSTGAGRNYRLIADGLGGEFIGGESRWPKTKTRAAQIGDFAIFTNGIDPVLAWPLGGGAVEGDTRLWSAHEISELVALGILRAEVICSWQGFVFIADVNVEGDDEHSQIYWCSFNRPLEWTPGGESSAGMYDFGKGEVVVNIAPIGGGLRVYTDRAIYSVTFVGGDVIFQFTELYRGDQAVAFKDSFVNAGSAHFWLTQESCAILGEYDKVPQRPEWMHRAVGYIFNGMDGRLLKNLPVSFSAFNPIDRERCYQIAAGLDERRNDLWLSWPTTRTSLVTPDDANDFDGVRRLSMVFNLRYAKAALVDHGFSAFVTARLHLWQTLRDFLIQYGLCGEDPPIVANYGCCVMEITTVSALPTATSGVSYSQTITATSGAEPYEFTVLEGDLPTGLTLDEATGIISGSVTQGGDFTFKIGVADSSTPQEGCKKEFTMTAIAIGNPYDTFEGYADGADANGLNGGEFWSGPYIV